MTAGPLDLTELSARSGGPAPRLRHFAEDIGLGADTLAAIWRDSACTATQQRRTTPPAICRVR